ncbi:RNA polymerase sigma factor [Sinomicrobium soli]|uniref:RNA polymerase sigma factor n=1 Tax=Sinomicrobium sp. N-1-3-6 TaxID=2219864 RepID=UPI000DCCBFF1|nr:sigma-70 family RNA polymerase sigma factor [Sinomicrobium sp. N-1-3-6]RAV27458.1 RNA polymerase subunit sigma-24 [Sinomicrobium sp. N-1-3-6]
MDHDITPGEAETVSRDREMLEQYIQHYSGKIYGFILFKIKDREYADDIFQDTVVRMVRAFRDGNYRETGRFDAWGIQIARNLITDHIRKQARNKTTDCFESVETSALADDRDAGEWQSLEEERKMIVDRLVKGLSPEQREVLTMRIYEGLSFKEISVKQQVSVNTALGRMRYALINLRKMAAEYGDMAWANL